MASALTFDRVTKSFPHHSGARLLRDRLMDLVHPSRRERIEILKNVSFEIPKGTVWV